MKPCGGWGGRARSRVCVWVCVQDVTSSAVALRRAEGKEGKVQGSGMLRIAARGRRRMMAFGFDGFDGFDGWSLDHCDHATDLGSGSRARTHGGEQAHACVVCDG